MCQRCPAAHALVLTQLGIFMKLAKQGILIQCLWCRHQCCGVLCTCPLQQPGHGPGERSAVLMHYRSCLCGGHNHLNPYCGHLWSPGTQYCLLVPLNTRSGSLSQTVPKDAGALHFPQCEGTGCRSVFALAKTICLPERWLLRVTICTSKGTLF